MPVEFPEFRAGDDAHDALKRFMMAVREFLDELVQKNQDEAGRHLFFEHLLDAMRDAWKEVNEHEHFPRVANRIGNLTEAQLRDHGLSGRQLTFKMAVIRLFHGRYLSVGKGILRRFLNIIDDLLKSVLEAVGAGGAIAEIKDFIKDSVDE
jgi:hypothetical protein